MRFSPFSFFLFKNTSLFSITTQADYIELYIINIITCARKAAVAAWLAAAAQQLAEIGKSSQQVVEKLVTAS